MAHSPQLFMNVNRFVGWYKTWDLHGPGYFMLAADRSPERPLPDAYAIESNFRSDVYEVRITSGAGELAASGFAAETEAAFIYDRIVTASAHRRRGLGTVVMSALRRAKREADKPELLVATADGRALYETVGWRTSSPYSTGSITLFEETRVWPGEPGARIGRAKEADFALADRPWLTRVFSAPR